MLVQNKEPEILVGALVSPDEIKTQEGIKKINEWDFRAMWSFLRLQYTRKIDDEIKAYCRNQSPVKFDGVPYTKLSKTEKSSLMWDFFTQKLCSLPQSREMQFIIADDKEVRAVASTKHLLIPPATVYDLAMQIIDEKHPELIMTDNDGLMGLSYAIPELAQTTFDLGLQIFGGDIFTRHAISLSSWLRVKLCFNPLSWLGSSGLASFAGNGAADNAERMLRIEVINDLAPRLRQAIDLQLKKTETLKQRVDVAKKVKVTRSDADIIMAAMGLSYGLGGKTIDSMLDRFEQEEQTLWGMSMASSWVASHGNFKNKGDLDGKTVQKLSTISGATILLNDVPSTKEKSIEWLSKHIRLGGSRTLDDLARRLKLWERQQP